MDVLSALACATDPEAEAYLNAVLKGWMATQPVFADLVTSPADLAQAVSSASREIGNPVPGTEIAPERRPKAIRAVLLEMAGDPSLRLRLEAAIEGYRPKLIEPVTTSLALAGIVMLLSTHVKVDYENKNGKKSLAVHVEKKPTATSILSKFFGFFK